MPTPSPDWITIEQITLAPLDSTFTQLVAAELGDAGSDADGFSLELGAVLEALPALAAQHAAIDASAAEIAFGASIIDLEIDPGIAFDADVIEGEQRRVINDFLLDTGQGVAPGEGGVPGIPEPPDISVLPAANAAEGIIPELIALISASDQPPGDGGGDGDGEPIKPSLSTFPVRGSAGLISVSADALVTWRVSESVPGPVQIWVSSDGRSYGIFAEAYSGTEPAPWIYVANVTFTFQVRDGDGHTLDEVSVTAGPLP